MERRDLNKRNNFIVVLSV